MLMLLVARKDVPGPCPEVVVGLKELEVVGRLEAGRGGRVIVRSVTTVEVSSLA